MVRTDSVDQAMKTFVIGTNASGANNGSFVINDLGTAVTGPGANRLTIANNGTAASAGRCALPGSSPRAADEAMIGGQMKAEREETCLREEPPLLEAK
jgi:hypothetical protein